MNFFETVSVAAVTQIITFLIASGFEQSYWGKNCREEITRFFDKITKHLTKQHREQQRLKRIEISHMGKMTPVPGCKCKICYDNSRNQLDIAHPVETCSCGLCTQYRESKGLNYGQL